MKAPAPVAKVRLGAVELAVWKQSNAKGDTYHTVSLQRSYKADGEWKNTTSFRLTDLKDIAAAAEEANRQMRVRLSGEFKKAPDEDSSQEALGDEGSSG